MDVPADFDRFHAITLELVPRNIGLDKPNTFWVGVLSTGKNVGTSLKQEDFLWIKCSQRTTVRTIWEQYYKKYETRSFVLLRNGSRINDDVTMRALDDNGDHIIEFQAVTTSSFANREIPQVKGRAPLVPTDRQVSRTFEAHDTGSKFPPTWHDYSPQYFKSEQAHSPAGENMDHLTIHRPSHQGPDLAQTYPEAGSADPREPLTAMDSMAGQDARGRRPLPALSHSGKLSSKAVDPGLNVIFLKFLDYFGSRGTLQCYSESYILEAAWEEWCKMGPKDRTPFAKDAERHVRAAGSLKDFPMAFTDQKPIFGKSEEEPLPEEEEGEVMDFRDQFGIPDEVAPSAPSSRKVHHSFRLQEFAANASLDVLEGNVKKYVDFLDEMKQPFLERLEQSPEAARWVQQIESLRAKAVQHKTIIGVVGNTGAGKSSVINAMLDEERLVPTNTMRACTAVVTELSYNHSNIRYRAEIEFITEDDWKKELSLLFEDLLDGEGKVCRDSSIEETDAGVAYAKIKAVYPKKTKEDIAKSSQQAMLREVSNILGKTRKLEDDDNLRFYKQLQRYIDSKEKSTNKEKERKKKGETKEMEYWPLIKVVRLFVKSDALSTGAVIVDLPGVHDANAARAQVAEDYIKQCTGLWIVSPQVRAVDDGAAKKLLGESFKRQLKMDGGFNAVSFICSKSDDISLAEATDGLGLAERNGPLWEQIDALEADQLAVQRELSALESSKASLADVMMQCDESLETWDALQDKVENGETVYAPSDRPGKRKKKEASVDNKRQKRLASDDDDFIDDATESSDAESGDAGGSDDDDDKSSISRSPLTVQDIKSKIAELRERKKGARKKRLEIDERVKDIDKQTSSVKETMREIRDDIARACIEGRNEYSRSAIQQDFAAGIRELDHEIAAEEDEANFDPDVDARDYEEVARSLPVFCVSARGYQKLQGRFRKEAGVLGFTTAEQTEIPALRAHCKQITIAGRTETCRKFMTHLSQLLNSLGLWSSNDGTGVIMTAVQKDKENTFLKKSLSNLENALERLVSSTRNDLFKELSNNIFECYESAARSAQEQAQQTCSRWGLPVDRNDRPAGGYPWSTYKAICRRWGAYTNAHGLHDFNDMLMANLLRMPAMKNLAGGWERTFARRVPSVMAAFAKNAGNLLAAFHRDVEGRSSQTGLALPQIVTMQQQLSNYEDSFRDIASTSGARIGQEQKDINREFVPVIKDAMTRGYNLCVEERGPGSFQRMKFHMQGHVENQRRTMFRDSCDQVRSRLNKMLQNTEETIANRCDEVYASVSHDYRAALGGSDYQTGQEMPKWYRDLQRDISLLLDRASQSFGSAVPASALATTDDEDADKIPTPPLKAEALLDAEEVDGEAGSATGRPVLQDALDHESEDHIRDEANGTTTLPSGQDTSEGKSSQGSGTAMKAQSMGQIQGSLTDNDFKRSPHDTRLVSSDSEKTDVSVGHGIGADSE